MCCTTRQPQPSEHTGKLCCSIPWPLARPAITSSRASTAHGWTRPQKAEVPSPSGKVQAVGNTLGHDNEGEYHSDDAGHSWCDAVMQRPVGARGSLRRGSGAFCMALPLCFVVVGMSFASLWSDRIRHCRKAVWVFSVYSITTYRTVPVRGAAAIACTTAERNRHTLADERRMRMQFAAHTTARLLGRSESTRDEESGTPLALEIGTSANGIRPPWRGTNGDHGRYEKVGVLDGPTQLGRNARLLTPRTEGIARDRPSVRSERRAAHWMRRPGFAWRGGAGQARRAGRRTAGRSGQRGAREASRRWQRSSGARGWLQRAE